MPDATAQPDTSKNTHAEAALSSPVSLPASPPASSFNLLIAGTLTLWQREMIRFLRQRNRVIGALATPIVFWLLLGSGLNDTFVINAEGGRIAIDASNDAPATSDSLGYLAYFFPGTITLILLFTAIFSTISVIEDRRDGFLQGVLVSPTPRLAIVLGKVFGGATLAAGQGVLFLLAWPFVLGQWPGLGAMLASAVVMFILAAGLTALGLMIAWPMSSTAGYHAIMNLFLMPMWFLCGAVFPIATAPLWLQVFMYANPLTYGQATLVHALHGSAGTASTTGVLPLFTALLLMLTLTIAMIGLCVRVVAKPSRDGN